MTSFRPLVGVAFLAGGCALLAAHACGPSTGGRPIGSRRSLPSMGGKTASYSLNRESSRVTVTTPDGAFSRSIDWEIVVDGVARPVDTGREPLGWSRAGWTLPLRLNVSGVLTDVELSFRVDSPSGALLATLVATPESVTDDASKADGADSLIHTLALRAEMTTEGRSAFVAGVGELADLGTVGGASVTLDAGSRTVGWTSTRGPLEVSAVMDEPTGETGSPMVLSITSPTLALGTNTQGTTDLRVVLAESSARIWRLVYALGGQATVPVRGVVTGSTGSSRVVGLDAADAPQLQAWTDPDGRFEVWVPTSVVKWFAALDAKRTSSPTLFVPGTPWELRLDVSPGGQLDVKIIDPDTGVPLTARLLVHGVDGTLDPSFGPDYRASGAGPLVDALRGSVQTSLPAGHYRVAATKGIEWSIDAKTIDILPGHTTSLELAPRHVVPTPGVVGADLHVHARPSFDTPVQPEDRVLSLVAAGIDFAVPTEHNIVGDYAPMLATLDLGHDLSFVNGVEVTTYSPRFGHFGVFPYSKKARLPPYRHSSPGLLFDAVRRLAPQGILQVNHPRLPMSIGYFDIYHFDPTTPRPPPRMRLDFDSLEVYNGYEMAHPERVDAMVRDYFELLNRGHRYIATGSSDSHRIQYQWAGYPRTMIALGGVSNGASPSAPSNANPSPGGDAPDPSLVIASLKKGHATVTTGPVLEVALSGAQPGDEIFTTEDPLSLHIRVRAAPWIDVSSVEIVVAGKVVRTVAIASVPTKIGPELGTLAEANERTLRYDAEDPLPLGNDNTWLMVIVRGTRRMDDVLPFMPIVPMALSNPIWITRSREVRAKGEGAAPAGAPGVPPDECDPLAPVDAPCVRRVP